MLLKHTTFYVKLPTSEAHSHLRSIQLAKDSKNPRTDSPMLERSFSKQLLKSMGVRKRKPNSVEMFHDYLSLKNDLGPVK